MGSAMENCRKWGFGPDVDGLPRKGQHFLAKQALREISDKVGMLAHTWLQSQEQQHKAVGYSGSTPPPHFSMIPGVHFTGFPAPSAPSSEGGCHEWGHHNQERPHHQQGLRATLWTPEASPSSLEAKDNLRTDRTCSCPLPHHRHDKMLNTTS